MLSQIVSIGNKIEIKRVMSSANDYDEFSQEEQKVYYSQVYDVIDEQHLRIGMPFEGSKLIPLAVNVRYDACFYTSNGLYQCRILAVDRYKEGNIAILVIELLTELQKFQRRQYFRLGCTMDIKYKKLNQDESEYIKQHVDRKSLGNVDGLLEGIALDLSGGGVRFVSDRRLDRGDDVLLSMEISYNEQEQKYFILGKVVNSDVVRNKVGVYEHRVEYSNIDSDIRESIIRYIFDEERKQRKRELG